MGLSLWKETGRINLTKQNETGKDLDENGGGFSLRRGVFFWLDSLEIIRGGDHPS